MHTYESGPKYIGFHKACKRFDIGAYFNQDKIIVSKWKNGLYDGPSVEFVKKQRSFCLFDMTKRVKKLSDKEFLKEIEDFDDFSKVFLTMSHEKLMTIYEMFQFD